MMDTGEALAVLAATRDCVRVGVVSAVDAAKRTVRVIYPDKLDVNGKPLVSGVMKVIQNMPLITVEKWVEELGSENKWDYEATYQSAPRGLGLGEDYAKGSYTGRRDVIKNEKIIAYEKRETIDENGPVCCEDDHPVLCADCGKPVDKCPLQGVIENKLHRQVVTVYPWLPHVDQLVLCLYLPNGESDGFVLGGI